MSKKKKSTTKKPSVAKTAAKAKAKAHKEQTLDIKDVKNMTLEEVMRKAEATDRLNNANESVLDKYIRQHRDEIEAVKNGEEVSKEAEKKTSTAKKKGKGKSTKAKVEATESDEKPSKWFTPDPSEAEMPKKAAAAAATVAAAAAVTEDAEPEVEVVEAEQVDPIDQNLNKKRDPRIQDQIIVDDAPEADKDTVEDTASKKVVTPVKDVTPEAEVKTDAQAATNDDAESDEGGNKKIIMASVGILAAAILGVAGYQLADNHAKNEAKTEQVAASKSKVASSEKVLTSAFDKVYATFFVDQKAYALKNTEFSKLPELKTQLSKLEDLKAYPDYQEKYTDLEKAIKAIQSANAQFDKAVITDGKLDATAKALTSDIKLEKSGVSQVDALLSQVQDMVDKAKEETAKSEAAASSSKAASESQAASEAAKASSEAAAAASSSQAAADNTDNTTDTTTDSAASSTTDNGGSSSSDSTSNSTGDSYNTPQISQGGNVDSSSARVPQDPNADLSNSAYTWAPGVFERFIAKVRERGYISGNSYILEPASIHNGNGYYNLYKPDGTYLVSVNAKTGYFVGNGAGHSDDLDY